MNMHKNAKLTPGGRALLAQRVLIERFRKSSVCKSESLRTQKPGEMLQLDTKKLGRIDGIGHRIHGDHRKRRRGIGWEFRTSGSTTPLASPVP